MTTITSAGVDTLSPEMRFLTLTLFGLVKPITNYSVHTSELVDGLGKSSSTYKPLGLWMLSD